MTTVTRNRGSDWHLEIGDTCEGGAFVRITWRGIQRSFEVKPGEALDLRITSTRTRGPDIEFRGHQANMV